MRRYNGYVCKDCQRITVTQDVDQGVTPMFLACRATPGCEGQGVSMMYPEPFPERVLANASTVWEWYKPGADDSVLFVPGMKDHVDRGGLALREARSQQTLMTAEEMERITTSEPKTPQEMADVMGVPVEDIGRVLSEQIALYGQMAQQFAERFAAPPTPNRAQRRQAEGKAGGRRSGQAPPKGWGK